MSKSYNPQDKYFKKAKKLGYRARSVFKLKEIQDKFKVLKPGTDVLDIGAYPGSWLEYSREVVGNKAILIGIDLFPIKKVANNVLTIEADIFSSDAEEFIIKNHKSKFQAILSDLAPKTSGIKDIDHYKSIELCERVVIFARKFLAQNGFLVIKIFQGPDFDSFLFKTKKQFKKVNVFKPKASRDRSFETYIIAKNF